MPVNHDADFIARLKQGESGAYRMLVDQYQLPLLRLCMGFLHQEDEARDVVQETFIEVFESVGTFREDARLATWLYRIAVNKSLNHIRRNRFAKWFVRLDIFTPDPEGEAPVKTELPEPEAEQVPENREKLRAIRRAVDTLPENQRTAFILNRYLDLSYKEIAEVTGMSLSSVESLLHRAKLGLQNKLQHLSKNN